MAVLAMDTIERKSLINKSGLGFWCVNAVQGCAHGCRYPCHAFLLARRYGRVSDYAAWRVPKLVGNALRLLDTELRRKRGIDCVHLSLTTDPFMVGYPEVSELSLRIIERVNAAGIPCSILTKGILPPELSDTRRFHPDNTYGISLVSLDEAFRSKWEPGASPYAVRIEAARALHRSGRRTRVHIEPFPTPVFVKQDVGALLARVDFVEHVYFGGWNYNAMARDFEGCAAFYEDQARAVRRFCEARGIACDLG